MAPTGSLLLENGPLLAFLLVVLSLSFRYPDRWIGTKQRRDLPGPPGLPLVGNAVLLYHNRFAMQGLLSRLHQEYGPLFTFTMPYWGRNIVVNRPEWLEHVKKGKQADSAQITEDRLS